MSSPPTQRVAAYLLVDGADRAAVVFDREVPSVVCIRLGEDRDAMTRDAEGPFKESLRHRGSRGLCLTICASVIERDTSTKLR
jgi:hypothetical protein